MKTLITILATTCAASGALAQHAGDVFLTVESGRIATNLQPQPGQIDPARVFLAEMGEIEPHFSDEPGFDCLPGTFPTPSAIGFRLRGPVQRWNGSRLAADSAPIFAAAYATLGPVFSPECNLVVDGFTIPVGANGTWHRHIEFTRLSPDGPGVFVVELELFSTAASIAPSRPFWFVFNDGADEADHDAAAEWVEEHLVPQRCPADFDRDGEVGVPDIFAFLTAWFAGPASPEAWRADVDGSCAADVQDIFAFLGAWFAGCP
ncbi:MAG: hypothetical protein KF699_15375 [Phycisphaeraceae bacterium]|nr:hypothetical protein [Phycisphaeraceae bacterium]